MNVHDIVKAYLKENKYDGLATDGCGCGGCGCGVDELFPHEECPATCEAAYRRPCSEGCEGCPLWGDSDGCLVDNHPPEPNDGVYIGGRKK